MNNLQLTQIPVAKAEMLIRKPVAEVFEAFMNPEITQPSVKPSASAVGIQASPCLGQGHRGNVRVKQMFLTGESPVLYTAFPGRTGQEQSQRIYYVPLPLRLSPQIPPETHP